MDKQELEIRISETGDVSVNVIGAKGKKCLEMTKELEEALGIVTDRETKSSFYEQESDTQQHIGGNYHV